MDKLSAYAALAVGMASMCGQVPTRLFREPKPANTCRLYGCTNTTTHNGGYCCAEHCKRDRVVKKRLWDEFDIRYRGDRWRFDLRYPAKKRN